MKPERPRAPLKKLFKVPPERQAPAWMRLEVLDAVAVPDFAGVMVWLITSVSSGSTRMLPPLVTKASNAYSVQTRCQPVEADEP